MKTHTRKTSFTLAALLPVLLMGTSAAQAQDEANEPAIYKCRQCVSYTGWRGTLDLGFGKVNDPSLRYADYRGLDEEGTDPIIDGDIHFRNLAGWYFDLYAKDSLLDSRQIDMRGGKQDRFQLRFGWREIPKYRGYGTQTPFLDVGTDVLSLPAGWVHAPTTDGMTTLPDSLVAAELKTQRKTFDAGATFKLGSQWSYKVDYQRQKKEGTRAMAGGLFNTAVVPVPVDFVTDVLETSLGWANKRAQIQVGMMRSVFENDYNSVTWRNPFGSRTQNNYVQLGLEPGNEFTQFNVSGAVVITPRIRFSGQAAMGELVQDDPFIPYYSTNPDYSDLVLPRPSLDGKLDTSTYNLAGKLFARLGKGLSFTLRGKYDERDNRTPVDVYTPVTLDLFRGGERYNRPYSYEREQYSADLRYRAGRWARFSAGAIQKNMERTLQAVEESEETTYWGELKTNLSVYSQVRIKVESGQRDVDDYLQPDDGGPIDHPLMRKFNQADRDLDRVTIQFDLAPTEALGINLSYFSARADYTESVFGLQESEDESYTIDLNYALGSTGMLYAFYTRDDIDSSLRSTTGADDGDWYALTNDEITTYGFGFSKSVGKKSGIGFDYVSSASQGNILVQTGEDEPFNPLRTDLTNAKMYFDHQFTERWGFKLYAELEKFDARDWAIDGYGVDGIPAVLTMGEESPDYDAWYFRVLASYRF